MGVQGFVRLLEISAVVVTVILAGSTGLIALRFRKEIVLAEKQKAAMQRKRIEQLRKHGPEGSDSHSSQEHEPAHVG